MMTTNILKTLSLSVLPTTAQMSPEQHRRVKLIGKLSEQKAIAEADRDGRDAQLTRRRWITTEQGGKALIDAPKRIKRWWLNDAQGNCLLVVRYGSKVLELDKGKAAIVVGKADNLIPTLDALITAVDAGELDPHLAQMGLARPLRKVAK
jgi:hypothetical protein